MKNSNNGIGFLGLLALIFIVLKLINIIDWTWLWVLSPILIPIGLISLFWLGMLVYLKLKK